MIGTGRIGHRGLATTFISVGSQDGNWRDEGSVLEMLPVIMRDAGKDADVPTWMKEHLEDVRKNAFAADVEEKPAWDQWTQSARAA